MKKVNENVHKDIGGAVLYSDDVEAISAIIQNVAEPLPEGLPEGRIELEREFRCVELSVPGHKLSPDEFSQLPSDPSQLDFTLHAPSISLWFDRQYSYLSVPNTPVGLGVAEQI